MHSNKNILLQIAGKVKWDMGKRISKVFLHLRTEWKVQSFTGDVFKPKRCINRSLIPQVLSTRNMKKHFEIEMFHSPNIQTVPLSEWLILTILEQV